MNKRMFVKICSLFSMASIGTVWAIWTGWNWVGVKLNGIHELSMVQVLTCAALGVGGMYLLTQSFMEDVEDAEKETIHEVFEEIREEITAVVTADDRYKEIERLEVMLNNAGIPFQKERYFNGWLLRYPGWDECRISVAEHVGSYGAGGDLLEMWDMKREDPEGWMSAEEVLLKITDDWVKHGKM
jgi:hypothetical protein